MYNAILIGSAIHTNNTPLSYTPIRSFFTHEERFKQTLETIHACRKYIPNAYIILIEVTQLIDKYKEVLSAQVDYLHLTHTDPSVYEKTEGPYKGLGEASSILSYLQSDHFNKHKSLLISVSKISGRYKPNPYFKFEIIPNKIICKISYTNPHHYSKINMSTMFYTIPIEIIDSFISALQDTCEHEELNKGIALEHILPICMLKKNLALHLKEPLFVEGEYGPWGGSVMH